MQVERLLAAHARAGHFLATSSRATSRACSARPADPSGDRPEGRRLRWSGSSGAAAWAPSTSPSGPTAHVSSKRVAIKVIKRGMDIERGARALPGRAADPRLARAPQHRPPPRRRQRPTTARRTSSWSYIEGQPIDAYCDAHALSVARRLELFLQVCATPWPTRTSSLVVHRDIKPSNILVDRGRRAQAARLRHRQAAGPARAPTACRADRHRLRLMTPEYASPEQVQGRPVTTAHRRLLARRGALRAAHRPAALRSLGEAAATRSPG